MSTTTASISIDWGTHSSKWTWRYSEPNLSETVIGPYKIVYSDVRLNDEDRRIFLSDEKPAKGSIYASSIKANLIRDPDEPFWVGPRKRMKLTLGELVTFSLWSLLGEAYESLCSALGKEPNRVDIRFSLPNWVDIDEGAAGRGSYEQAAKVACYIFASDRRAWGKNQQPVREDWQAQVGKALSALNISDDSEINTDSDGFRSVLQQKFRVDNDIEFRFVAESSAAGLSGLRDEEADVEDRYLRKILVVDIGAGSTDIGYLIRSIPVEAPDRSEVLIQLPPANTCQIAGADLTHRIVEICRSQGELIPFEEAEIRKITGEDKGWLEHPSVEQWKSSIAEHVKRYVAGIPDEHWLPLLPPVHLLVTGGSGVVDGLQEEILAAVKEGLQERGISANVIDTTRGMSLSLEGRNANDVNRLAVAWGAASEDLPRLSYYDRLERPMHVPPVRAIPSWT